MGLIIGQGKSGGGGGGASSAEKALAKAMTLDGMRYNLFSVLEQVKKDSRIGSPLCIMVCRYFRYYESISLSGANRYYTSDGGYHSVSETHYWQDTNSDSTDRWVAYIFDTQKSISFSNIVQPAEMLVDGIFTNGIAFGANIQCQNIYTTDGSSIGYITSSSANTTALNNVQGANIFGAIENTATNSNMFRCLGSRYVSIGIKEARYVVIQDGAGTGSNLEYIQFPNLERISTSHILFSNTNGCLDNCREIFAKKLAVMQYLVSITANISTKTLTQLRRFVVPKLVSANGISRANDTYATPLPNLMHIEIGQGFYTDFNLGKQTFANCLKTDTNDLVEDLQAHPTWSNLDQFLYNFEHLIVDKLADLAGQTAKTITLAAAPYAAITSEIRSKMSAKNWNLASA